MANVDGNPLGVSCYGKLGDHSDSILNKIFRRQLEVFFGSQGDGKGNDVVRDNRLGKGSVKFHPHIFDVPDLSKIDSTAEENNQDWKPDNDSIETGVWLVTNPLSNVFKEEIMREVNLLTFLGSSQEVGANSKKKSRYYRVSTKLPSGRLFHLSSDASLIECTPMQEVEKKLVDLVSNLMEEQDKIIAEANPGGKCANGYMTRQCVN